MFASGECQCPAVGLVERGRKETGKSLECHLAEGTQPPLEEIKIGVKEPYLGQMASLNACLWRVKPYSDVSFLRA